MFRVQCMSCYTVDRYRSVRRLLAGRDRTAIADLLTMLKDSKPDSPYRQFVPPLVGTREEMHALTGYLDQLINPTHYNRWSRGGSNQSTLTR